mmetsp:Transcript_31106/g.47515  ORF Transcript_31106/g.47515 Transcript_31106/m.47515 type:complete len:117 (-) Transcript_31106:776-1126(-)
MRRVNQAYYSSTNKASRNIEGFRSVNGKLERGVDPTRMHASNNFGKYIFRSRLPSITPEIISKPPIFQTRNYVSRTNHGRGNLQASPLAAKPFFLIDESPNKSGSVQPDSSRMQGF